LDAKARAVLGRVGEFTKPAQHLLENIGFEYLDEVDPFDGGPHYGCDTADILPIKMSKRVRIAEFKDASYKEQGLMGTTQDDFKATVVNYDLRVSEVAIPSKARSLLGVSVDEEVILSPFTYKTPAREQT
jgi:arginine N-succinyltransferase